MEVSSKVYTPRRVSTNSEFRIHMDVFADLIGQEKATQLLQQAVVLNRIAPAYLFHGKAGIGRTMAAKSFTQLLLGADLPPEKQHLLAKKLQAGNHPDLLWIQPTYKHQGEIISAQEAAAVGIKRKTPPKIRIEQIRYLTQFLSRYPLEASRLVVVIEDAQNMAEAPANALLKTLEEPGNATLILIAPNTDSLLPTLVSRCQRIQFYPLSQANLELVLQHLGYQAILQHPELMAIAQGSPGAAIESWQQLQALPPDLLPQLCQLSSNYLEAIKLAKIVSSELDMTTQLWLVDYLQYYYWQQGGNSHLVQQWEQTRQQLLSYVQPRLVWECTLLNLLDLLF